MVRGDEAVGRHHRFSQVGDNALMADVVIVCVRKDVVAAESLADMFEAVGLDVRDAGVSDDELRASGAAVVSYCRLPDGPSGAWTADCSPTFGAANKAP